jgi:glycosyltransferase involved in cell wall biosynthesis
MSDDTAAPLVVVITTTFPGHDGDGTPAFVQDLSQAMASHGRVLVVAPRMPGSARQERMGSIDVVRVAYFPRRWESLAAGAIVPALRESPSRLLQAPPLVVALLVRAWREVRRRRADVVHAHWVLPGGLIGALVTAGTSRRLIVTLHGADAYALDAPPLRWLKRFVLGRADLVVPVSEDIARVAGLPAGSAMPMGIAPAHIAAGVGHREPRPDTVLFVGRLAEKKGVDDLLTAVARVPGVSVRVGGDGPMRKALEEQAHRLGLSDRVRFLGQLGRAEVYAELRTAGAIAIPSKVASDGDQDGTPVVLMEAVAAGVPVLATRLGGLGEHVVHDRTGLLVDPGDTDALAAQLQRLVVDPSLGRRLADTARTEMLPAFDVDEIARRYLEVVCQPEGGRR